MNTEKIKNFSSFINKKEKFTVNIRKLIVYFFKERVDNKLLFYRISSNSENDNLSFIEGVNINISEFDKIPKEILKGIMNPNGIEQKEGCSPKRIKSYFLIENDGIFSFWDVNIFANVLDESPKSFKQKNGLYMLNKSLERSRENEIKISFVIDKTLHNKVLAAYKKDNAVRTNLFFETDFEIVEDIVDQIETDRRFPSKFLNGEYNESESKIVLHFKTLDMYLDLDKKKITIQIQNTMLTHCLTRSVKSTFITERRNVMKEINKINKMNEKERVL